MFDWHLIVSACIQTWAQLLREKIILRLAHYSIISVFAARGIFAAECELRTMEGRGKMAANNLRLRSAEKAQHDATLTGDFGDWTK